MSEQFKAGDEVYCPKLGLKICTLEKGIVNSYPIRINEHNSFSLEGKAVIVDSVQSIFHATPENKLLLEALYKCDFESPKLKGSDLTRKLLSEGKHVLCYVSDQSEDLAVSQKFAVLVTACVNSTHPFYGTAGYKKYAVPCNDYANLADGVLIKSEQ
jgi:hypothetical protein